MAEVTGVKVSPPKPNPPKKKTDKAPKTSLPPKDNTDEAAKAKTKAEPKKSTPKPRGRPPALEKQLEDFFTFIGMTVYAFNPVDGETIQKNAKSMAEAWANLAREDARVKAFLDRMTTGSAWGQVIFATAALAIQIAGNHDALPAIPGMGSMFGVSEPAPAPQPPPGAPQGPPTPQPPA